MDIMRSRKDRHIDPQRLIDELEVKQKNTIWPGPLINGASVDKFLWSGSARPSLVQSIAAILFGLLFLCGAAAFCSIAIERHSIIVGIVSLGALYLGGRVLSNSVPKRAHKGR